MRNIKTLWHAALILSLSGAVCASFPNPAAAQQRGPAAVGTVRANWTDLPGVDGKRHSLADLASKDVVVVAITCNHCPIAIEYYDRMKEFVKRKCGPDSKISLVAISVSDVETDKLPRMKEMAERKKFNFAYLHDESQQTAKQLGAIVTPQFFVLNKDRVLIYRGAWDDNVNQSLVKTRYVEEAIAAALAGRTPAVTETKARGCLIDYIDSP